MPNLTAEQVSVSTAVPEGGASDGPRRGAVGGSSAGRGIPLGKNNHYSVHPLAINEDCASHEGHPRSCVSSEPYRADLWRLSLQRAVRDLIPGSREAKCLWSMVGPWVSGRYSDAKGKASFGRVVVCGRIWGCPVCSAVIAARRASEVEAALLYAEHVEELRPVPITRTMRHSREDGLAALIEGFRKARERSLCGRVWRRVKDEYDIQGSITSLEVTWGERSGWHVHSHEVWFVPLSLSPSSINDLEAELLEQWQAALEKGGMASVTHRGLQVGRAKVSAEYLVKVAKAAARELVLSVNKRARGENLNPLQLLEAYLQGDKRAGRLWQEYHQHFQGRQQLVWSRGLRARLLPGDENLADEDIASEEAPAREVVRLLPVHWSAVRRADARSSVLRAIEQGEKDGAAASLVTVGALLEALGCENACDALREALTLPEPSREDLLEELHPDNGAGVPGAE